MHPVWLFFAQLLRRLLEVRFRDEGFHPESWLLPQCTTCELLPTFTRRVGRLGRQNLVEIYCDVSNIGFLRRFQLFGSIINNTVSTQLSNGEPVRGNRCASYELKYDL